MTSAQLEPASSSCHGEIAPQVERNYRPITTRRRVLRVRVLLLLHAYLPEHCASAELMAHTLARALLERGHERTPSSGWAR